MNAGMVGRTAGAIALIVALAGCAEDPASLEPGAVLLSVTPAGGAVSVDPAGDVVAVFDHPLHKRMAGYAMLHEGDVQGPEVDGSWRLEADRTRLVFTPGQPLRPATIYTVHLAGGMTDAFGRHVDLETHGPHMGGHWADGAMMGGGMTGPGQDHMGSGQGHMGDGWRCPTNGSYGMVFSFTTAD